MLYGAGGFARLDPRSGGVSPIPWMGENARFNIGHAAETLRSKNVGVWGLLFSIGRQKCKLEAPKGHRKRSKILANSSKILVKF